MALAQGLVEAPVLKAAASEPATPVLETSFDNSYPLHIPIQPHGYLPMLKTSSRIWGGGSVEDLNLVSQTHGFFLKKIK